MSRVSKILKIKIADTKQRFDLIKEFRRVFLHKDFNYFSIAYSGGKDSTLTMALFFDMLNTLNQEELNILKNKHIYIINSDTGIEIPDYQFLVDENLENIKRFLKEKKFKHISVKQAKPELKNTYFSLIIGKGYTLPRTDFRWCSQRLKIAPNDKLFKKIFEEVKDEKIIIVTGSRKEESVDRKKRLEENTLDGFLKKDITGGNKILFTPIENLTSKDVWRLLDYYEKKYSHLNITQMKELYKKGSRSKDEINTRFGCMYCPIMKRDYTLENVSKHKIYLKPILRFRNWLVNFQNDWNVRDYYSHRNFKVQPYDFDNHRKGMVSPGGYSIDFRIELLEKLLQAEKRANKLYQVYLFGRVTNPNAKSIQLISKEELAYIQEKWTEEGDIKLRALRIAKKYNRSFIVTDLTMQIKNIAEEILSNTEDYLLWDIELTRKACVFAKEFLKTGSSQKALEKAWNIDILKDYQVKTIKKEWKEDKISFVTFLEMVEEGKINIEDLRDKNSLFEDYGEYTEHVELLKEIEQGEDIIYSDKLSLEEKYKFLDGFTEVKTTNKPKPLKGGLK